MAEDEPPRTRLAQVLHQRHWTVREFLRRYQDAAGEQLSERQAYRWIAGNLRKQPYPHAQAALERLFGEPVTRLLGPPYGLGQGAPAQRPDNVVPLRGNARTDWEGQVIAMCADRARDFLARAESSNVGPETMDQLVDDVRRLVTCTSSSRSKASSPTWPTRRIVRSPSWRDASGQSRRETSTSSRRHLRADGQGFPRRGRLA